MNAPTVPSSIERAESLQGLGGKRKRVEDARFIQGKGNFVDDIKLPGMLHGDFHRSSHGHARIVKRIDASKAKALPGVVAVLIVEDLKPIKLAGRRRWPATCRWCWRRQGLFQEPGDRLRRGDDRQHRGRTPPTSSRLR